MNHMSMVEAAEKIGVSQPTISAWEAERKCPSVDAVERMATLYGVTTDYLLGRPELIVSASTNRIDNRLLSVMDGQPVWSPNHGWLLVCAEEQCLRNAKGQVFPFADAFAELYISPIAFSSIIPPQSEPLSRNNLRRQTEIWVEPISSDATLREELRGWYRLAGAYAENKNGNRFSLASYEAKWLAFEDTPLNK